ncbi:hypothetical protein GPECTOR_446g334 [Gonium pectorale]|uniref:Uncharacterized protein n=1 Tax=Gonium pectorale TaxID=33097 RepID=A0A150FV40_GONPE|nr:hypothetical protein GPECTOR_446g334 [Gonium pectorale]|eukprot:KXZ41474.1 hypothetical protein GPECTOR_446g334 [Gonium pectorale]
MRPEPIPDCPYLSIATAGGRCGLYGILAEPLKLVFCQGTSEEVVAWSCCLVVDNRGAEGYGMILGTNALVRQLGASLHFGGRHPHLCLRRGYEHPQPCEDLPVTRVPLVLASTADSAEAATLSPPPVQPQGRGARS